MLAWLNKTAIASVLREFGTGQRAISHAGLDELPASKPVEHLRAILVATSTLPPRDEHLARLERWIARTLAERGDPEQRQLLHRYAVWHLLRRLRQRNNGTYATHAQVVTVQRHVRAAIALLDGLGTRGRALADARQADLDAWLTSDQASHRRDAGHFVRWANRTQADQPGVPRNQMARPRPHHRHRDPLGTSPMAAARSHRQPRRPGRRPARAPLRADPRRDQPPHPRACPDHRTRSAPSPRPRTRNAARTTRRPDRRPRSPGAAATPRLATREPPPGCSPAAAPASRSAPTSSPNACASSDCAPRRAAPPHCSASPPNFPPPCSPGCSASTSRSPSHGNTPPLATGPPTPPTTAAANQPPPKTPNPHLGTRVSETHSDSWNNRVHQVGPRGIVWTGTPPTSSPPTSQEPPGRKLAL